MKLLRRRFLELAACTAVLGLLCLVGQGAWSETARTVRFFVPVPPGGGMDFVARVLADQIGRTQGVTMVVESHPGAGGRVATETVSHLPPDGTTVLMVDSSFVIHPHLHKVGYEPLTSFEPVCKLVEAPNVIAVNAASPYRTLAELMDAAHASPGSLTLASIGPESSQQIAIEKARHASGIGLTFVPYPGSAPTVNALLGEHVSSLLAAYTNVAEQISAGRLRPLAVATAKRIAALPDVPTVAEAGFKDLELDSAFGLVVPAKTPRETVAQLTTWFTAAIQAPEIKTKLAAQGLYPAGACGADYAAQLREQYDDFGRTIRDANIKAE